MENLTKFRNRNIQIILIVGLLIFIVTSCSESIVESPTNSNLLPNGSFEKDYQPTLEGWRFGNQQLAESINEASPNGGSWSLLLTADWAPTTAFVYTPILNVTTGDIVALSAFVRVKDHLGGSGIIKLVSGPDINAEHSKSITSSDTVWTQISLTDTLNLELNDTLWVVLSAPITEIVPFKQLFDLVKLEIVSK